MAIKVLSDQLASQIAAGEVVERPASAVRELVENAIDAGATTIHVDIRDGGRKLIQIADNGIGMDADEVATAFLRHATSKLDSAESLASIATLGFRGEALAAISSVSRVTVVTRSRKTETGTRLVLEGGQVVSRDQVGAPGGTVIAVEDLFYNTPARLKFLKSVNSEKRAIDEFLTRYATAYPHIRIRLTHNGRVTFQTGGTSNVRDVLLSVYGTDTGRQFLKIKTHESGTPADTTLPPAQPSPPPRVTATGYISPPGLHRSNRSHISLFVNGRWIKDQRLTYAVIEAYHTINPQGRYPLAVIFIEMPFEEVDVNVHPMKTEVRFRYPRQIFKAVQKAVRNTLLDTNPVRVLPDSPFQQLTSPEYRQTRYNSDSPDWGGSYAPQPTLDLQRPEPAPPITTGDQIGQQAQHETPLGGVRLPIMRVVGQVRAAFIITEGPDGMFLIDQHAAHERILFEQFMNEWQQKQIASQQLVTGLPVQVTPGQSALLDGNLDRLAGIGFHVEPFGPNTFVVRSVPALLAKSDPGAALQAMVEDLEDSSKPMQTDIEEAMIKKACKTAAIKAGQTLSSSEMDALVRQLEECETPPHLSTRSSNIDPHVDQHAGTTIRPNLT